MPPVDPSWRPLPLAGLPPGHPARKEPEIAALLALAAAGLPVATVVVVPAEAEERFYRLNNLPERLSGLFAGVDLRDPDEDDLEELAPEAQALLRGHFLLDEVVDAFYEATASLPARLAVRRPDADGVRVGRGRPALLALKRAWADEWTVEALDARLRGDGGLAPTARPVLVHGPPEPAPAELAARVRATLGEALEPFVAEGGVARLAR